MHRLRVFVGFSLLVCLFCSPALAVSSEKTVLSLAGAWTETSQGTTTTLNVPTSIPFFGGTSVWTRVFSLNLTKSPLVAYLEFDGVANTATVKLNGQIVGTLTAFTHTRLDVRAALIPDGDNTLELDIDDRLTSNTVPGGPTESFVPAIGAAAYALPVSWSPDSGIFRDVSLVYSDHAVMANMWVSQVFAADFSSAQLNVRVRVVGADASSLYGGAGLALSGGSEGVCLLLQVGADVLDCNLTIANPALWSPSQPTLHDFTAVLYDASGAVDFIQDQIGLRKIEVSGNRLLVNGNPLFLRGITRHDIYGSQGFVANEATVRQDFTQMQRLGINFVRCIHYPPDIRVARIADQMGMLLSEEIPVYAEVQNPTVVTIAESMVTALIERDYNRASVVVWITGNGPILDANYLGSLTETVMLQDGSRPTTFVIDDPQSTTPLKIAEDTAYLRNAGIHLYAQNAYWYSAAIDELVPAMPTDMPVIVTEWSGSEGSDLGPIGLPGTRAFPDYDFPSTGSFPTAFQAYTIYDALMPWIPFTNCASRPGASCVTGITFFNWQDIAWTGMPYFYTGHSATDSNGLVYEDRTPKAWPQVMFQYVYGLLPQ